MGEKVFKLRKHRNFMEDMREELAIINGSIADLEWFKKNFSNLRIEFPGELVAIKDQEVVGSAQNIQVLFGKLREKGVEENLVLIKRVTPQGEIVIL